MKLNDLMTTLKKMGTAQNRKVYQRHGAGDVLFGVSFADLKALKNKINVDQDLAEELWATGNTDARTLALMIADPAKINAAQAEEWLKDIRYYLLADIFCGVIAETSYAISKIKKWSKSRREYTRQSGYSLLTAVLKEKPERVSSEFCSEYLEKIESEIHESPNRARHTMNNALIAIGLFKPTLKNAAIQAARRIGKVEVDHGQTSCKTPSAEACIRQQGAQAGRSRKAPSKRKSSTRSNGRAPASSPARSRA